MAETKEEELPPMSKDEADQNVQDGLITESEAERLQGK